MTSAETSITTSGETSETASSVLRIAAVGYLNAEPLYAALVASPHAQATEKSQTTANSDGFSLQVNLASPREAARAYSENDADIGLIPVAAAAGYGDVRFFRAACIAARGPVRSVAVFSQRPLEELTEIALDLSSRTSVVLLRILLAKRGLSPKLVSMSPDACRDFVSERKGALLIGDAALKVEGTFAYTFDLAEAWFADTGLPFVFAAWTCSSPFATQQSAERLAFVEALLASAKEQGKATLAKLAQTHAEQTGLSARSLTDYLQNSIRYDFGPEEERGLLRFFAEAEALKLLPRSSVHYADERHVPRAAIDTLLLRAADGERLSVAEGERLFAEASLFELGFAADAIRTRKHPHNVVTYIVDRNVNYTNVCTTSCRFCAFYRPVGHVEGYVLSREVLAQKLQEVVDAGGVQILLQGGLNPELRIEWYESLFQWMKSTFGLGLHALSPEEIIHLSELEGLPVKTVLTRLHKAGLDSVPGGGAEILVDRVRKQIAKTKCRSEEWLGVMRTAHELGLRSSCTMMYGTIDTPRDRVLHLLKLRDLQDETGGFTAFFCWDFQHEQGVRIAPSDTGTEHYLRMQALARIMLDNVDHVGASWVTQGPSVGQVALRFGADDFGSIMFEENVVSSAGTTFRIDASGMEKRIHEAGFRAVRRNVRYEWLSEPR
jgi:cyclic dehypoxanthinyl futalosine synthase